MTFDRAAFADDLAALVGFRTEVCRNPDEFRRANEWILEQVLGDVEVDVDSHECDGLTTLVIRRAGSPRPVLLADTHLEVVPAADDHAFTLRRDGDRLVGRGTADMKTQLLAVLHVLRDRLRRGEPDDLWLVVSQDEEVGSRAGTAVVLDDLRERDLLPPVAFVPDGGPDFTAVVAEKGVVHARAVATGPGAHGSRPWLAPNPIATLCAVHEALGEQWPDPDGEDDWRPSVTLARLEGGHAANRVPDRAEAVFDVRFPADVDQGEVVQVLRRVAADHDVDLELDNLAQATSYDLTTPLGAAWLGALAAVAGRDEAPTVRTAGASNGRFWHSAGAEVLMANPTSGNAHAADEWVAVDALEPFVQLVDRTVTLAHEHHG